MAKHRKMERNLRMERMAGSRSVKIPEDRLPNVGRMKKRWSGRIN